MPDSVRRVFTVWRREYVDELEELYRAYVATGRTVFGGAFHQLGTFDAFVAFVFEYMHPGAHFNLTDGRGDG